MQEIKCPKCGEVFVVDESGYANIVKQVRDKEFAKELKKREEELKDAQQKDFDLVRLEQKNKLQNCKHNLLMVKMRKRWQFPKHGS